MKVEVIGPSQLKEKPPVKDLGFGKHFTDHMLRIKWSEAKGWETPVICQMQNFSMHPAAKVRQFSCITCSLHQKTKPPIQSAA